MKHFFLNCINNIVKRKRENKVKQILNIILERQRDGHLGDDDVVYPLSALCSFLNDLSDQVRRLVHKQHGRRDGQTQAGKGSPPLTRTQLSTPRTARTASTTATTSLTALHHFSRTSQLHVRSFVEALLKQFHAKGDPSEETIRSCTYLLNALCLLDYDGQENHCRELLSRVVNSFVQLNRRYLSHVGRGGQRGQVPEGTPTQWGVRKTQNDPSNRHVGSQMLVEVLTVINKHYIRLRSSNEEIDLLSVFYLEVVNYLFASTALRVRPPAERHPEGNHRPVKEGHHRTDKHRHVEAEPHPGVVVTRHIDLNRMDLNRIGRFYSEVHLDVHHFVSIALFVKKYAEALNRFDLRGRGFPKEAAQEDAAKSAAKSASKPAEEHPDDGYPISRDHLRRTLSTATVHIYLHLFWRPKWEESSQGGQASSNRRQHICSEEAHLGGVPSQNVQKGPTSYAYREGNSSNATSPNGSSPHGSSPNGSCPFLFMWSYFPDEFSKLYKSDKINMDFVLSQNVMDIVSCLKTLSLKILASDSITCDHFNRRIYSHVLSFRLLLNVINGERLPRRDFLVSALSVYYHFWHFILKFYSSLVYTNTLVSLLGCFCAGRMWAMKRSDRDPPIRMINAEVVRRWKETDANGVGAPSGGHSFSEVHTAESEYPHGSKVRSKVRSLVISQTPQCPLLLANRRHLFNMCSLYAQLNFHDEAFARLLTKTTTHNLTQLSKKDIMAVVFYLGKAPPTQGEMLLHLVRQIQRHITTYDMCDLHLTLKTLLKYTNQQGGKTLFATHFPAIILHHVLIRVLIVCSKMETEDKAAQSPWQGKTKEEVVPHQVDFTKTLHEFYDVLISSEGFQKMLVIQRGNTPHVLSDGTTALSIIQEEMQAVYSKVRRPSSWFMSLIGELTRGEKKPFLRNTLNILNVAVKLMKSMCVPLFGDDYPPLYEACCLHLFDALYLLIKRTKNLRDCFTVSEWVSLILCHCKVGHMPDYLNEYLALLHGKLPAEIRANQAAAVAGPRGELLGVHIKDLRLIRMLSQRLKLYHLKNAELFAPFLYARGSLNDYIYKLLLRRFKKVTHKGPINIFKSVLSPQSSYNVDLLFSCNYTISEIKKKIAEYMYELKLVDGEKFKAVYLGKRRLVRPIKKQMEAYYVLFSFQMYPSLIHEIKRKLSLQDAVLRFMITKNEKTSRCLEYEENEPVRQGIAATEAQFFKRAD
ncbi:hypothetical protein C922_04927 [Plasmodium inui San Antonio 1]|uniref:Ribosomal protein S6 n=1 Tax=Plasmodium inui San Antonio 1 TaxID=1237626 RepID=W7AHD2_9APIC|nr:hypothetical protein C922_04927 [Plasmodium inui San Antonio 1]EUD64671.1 hypothetical protein C922_04927 [Plasmodium inui San Antonio 1]